MATHAHSTHTPLLPLSRSAQPLLGTGLGRQPGPVTQAIRAMRAAEPVRHSGYASQFTHGIRALSRTEVEDLIGSLIDLLDAMDGDADREPEVLDASATEWTGRGAHRFNVGEAA